MPFFRQKMALRDAFTLIELLIVTGIISVLAAILLPALSAGRQAALDLKCRSQLRTVTQAFTSFATETSGTNRGDSEKLSGLFRIEDFQESIYRIHEFWDGPVASRSAYNVGPPPLLWPGSSARMERRAGIPCSSGAVTPQRSVSIGFNKRLETRTQVINGVTFGVKVYLGEKILQYPDVPLLLDIDGETATSRGVVPYYSAPPLPKETGPDIYLNGKYWFPSFRHRKSLNVGFVGGHVLSSRQPLSEPWWRWNYQPN
ncbi:MAG: type II secretion system protein [Planctomycetota bacterium]